MELLQFRMHPFKRLQWASKEIKDKWEDKFKKACSIYPDLELLSVIHGLRHCTTGHISPEGLDSYQQNLARQGLYFLPIQKVGVYEGMSSYHPPVVEGKPYNYYGVIADTAKHAVEFVEATKNGDHIKLGELLGFPKCCSEFFEDVWRKQGFVDPTYHQALNTEGHIKNPTKNAIRLKNVDWELNTFMSVFNLGVTFHKTCSHDCKHSLDRARKWLQLAEDLKMDGLEDLKLLMQMPMEWDSMKGIAYIRSPLFKASYNSNTTAERFIVQREGVYYPEEAPMGLEFPYNEYYKSKRKLVK